MVAPNAAAAMAAHAALLPRTLLPAALAALEPERPPAEAVPDARCFFPDGFPPFLISALPPPPPV